MLYPDLRRLALVSPTGGNAEGKRPMKSARPGPSSESGDAPSNLPELPSDLIPYIMGLVEEGDREAACRTVARWCAASKQHAYACNEQGIWRTLLQTYFPNTQVPITNDARADFYNACDAYQADKLAVQRSRDDELRGWGILTSAENMRKANMPLKKQREIDMLEFHNPEERDISRALDRAQALLKKADELEEERKRISREQRRDIRPLSTRLIDRVKYAIKRVWAGRKFRAAHPYWWDEEKPSYERQVAGLFDVTRSLEGRVKALERSLEPPPMQVELDIPPRMSPSEPFDPMTYDSDDEPGTPPGFGM